MIDKEKLNQINKELGKIQIHHTLFMQSVDGLDLTTDDIIEVVNIFGIKKRGYYNCAGIYCREWSPNVSSVIYLNNIKKDGTKSRLKDCIFGPLKEIRIINHNLEEEK